MELEQELEQIKEWKKILETICNNEYDGYIALRTVVEFYNKLYGKDEKIVQHAILDYKILFYTVNLFERNIRFYLADGLVLSFYILGAFKSAQKLCYSIYSLSGGE